MRSRFNRRNLWVLVLLAGLFVWWAYSSNQLPSIAPAPPPPVNTAAISPATRTAPSGNRNLLLGNPSGAAHDPSQPTNYLIERPQYVLSYNRDHGIPNWVSWQVTQQDLGDTKRSDTFVPDTTLPKGWYRVTLDDYTGSGYDRGHMCPSADRTATDKDNQATFVLTNVLPQAPGNNRSTWEHLESLSRQLVSKGHVLYIVAGGDGANGTIAKGKVVVPRYTWKIIVVMPKGESDVTRITADTPVIAVRVPNGLKEKLGDWDQYRVTVASIEAATGYHFFTNLAPDIQDALKSRVDTVPTN
jgi:endonuclease G, mitochondrial